VNNGSAISYQAFAARIMAARGFLEAQSIDRSRIAILCIHDVLSSWAIGLALRSLGVTTVNARSNEDIEQLGLGPATVVALTAETGAWVGLAAAARQAGQPFIVAPETWSDGVSSLEVDEAALIGAAPGGHVLLTSATTGDYKKVRLDAAAAKMAAEQNAAVAGLTEDAAICVFGFGGWTAAGYIWPQAAWSVGAAIVADYRPEPWRSLTIAAEWPRCAAVTTPHMLASLLAAPSDVPLRNDAMTLIVVGGVLSQAQWRLARERLTDDVRSIYGATETLLMTHTRLRAPEDLEWYRVIPGCDVQVVDEEDRPLDAGRVGVVRTRPTRASEYLDDPAATRAYFRHGYFYPGDLGVLDENGRLALRGRVTDVINVLGNKYGALPIESALRDSLGAKDVCVYSTPAAGGEQVHVAIQLGQNVSPAELKSALLEALPRGIANVEVHAVDGFPRNHMGKIDRSKLMAQLALRPVSPAREEPTSG
jgi:acyl-coenzyme A synthetase/AMP-(fatty) acid ligase